jgi:uncharacterized protein (DUF58 family)
VLSPSAVGAIDDLELAARLIVEGAHTGRHRSPFHGFAAEFSQHRPYRPGDDLKYLDWKILGRTDRLYSRRFRETTNLSAMIVLDASASMNFPRDGEEVKRVKDVKTSRGHASNLTKFQYAVLMGAALAHVIIEQGDAAGLITMSGDRFVYLPPKGGRTHLHAMLTMLARLEPAGAWQLDRVLARGGELLKRRGVMVAVSDFYDATETTYRELRRIGHRGHDVALLQVLSPAEISFPYSGAIEFEHLETAERRFLDAGDAAAGYRRAVSDFLTDSRAQAHRDGHDYALLPTDVAPERALRSYLIRRARASAPAAGARSGRR